jgi:hypothetical protein
MRADLMQRLPRLLTRPYIALLCRGTPPPDEPSGVCNVAQSRQGEPHYAHAVSTKFKARDAILVIGVYSSSSNPMLYADAAAVSDQSRD